MSRWPVTVCFAFIALFCLPVQANRQEDIVTYLNHLAYALQKEHLGVFNCWLLEFYSNSTHSTMLNSLAHQLNAQHASLLQANHQANYVPTIREPSMVIILWGQPKYIADSIRIHHWITGIPPECPTIVLFERSSGGPAQPWQVGTYLATRMVFNFALIAINEDAMFTFQYEPVRITTHTGFPERNELFFDRLQTIQHKSFTAAYIEDFYTIVFCNNLLGEDMALFVLFAETLQFTVNFLQLQCNRHEDVGSCVSRYSGIQSIVNRLYLVQYNKFLASGTTMGQIAIATPKGRMLTVWEMLLKPFQASAWTMLFAIIVTFQLIQLCLPTLFANNVLALALFGFEKRKLRLTRFAEKVTASALIIFFFQLKCAYEAKLVSYLTETPRLPDATSLEDLRARNITVYYRHINIDNLDKLAGMLAPYDSDNFVYDGITLLDNREALAAEKMFADGIEGYSMLYTILPDNVFEILPFYVFGEKSMFHKRFQKYQQRIFEAGMQMHWRQKHFNCFLLHIIGAFHKRGAYERAYAAIRFEHLKPLILFFLAHWAFDTVVFVVEVIVGWYGAYKRSRFV